MASIRSAPTSGLRPVNSVIAAPTASSPSALRSALSAKASVPSANRYGSTGSAAPAANAVSELSAARVIRLSYELLAIQSFFTVGEDEVRAWSVAIGATAPEAAGAIHTDLQKGFIRAEVMKYDELLAAGSEAAMKATGKLRLEGKEYIVKDGDIVHIRHSS